MSLSRVWSVCFFVLFSLSAQSAFAKGVDLKTTIVSQQTDYGLLQTEIHFDQRDTVIAQKIEKIIRTDLIKVINYFHYVPQTIVHINVDPYMRLPNGNARVFTNTVINVYNFPSNNADHLIVMEDWLKGLVLHEFVHITHLDQTRGYLDAGRQIFGSIAKLPANLVPRWFTEGIAVWGESHLMNGGRLHSPMFRKELLIQFLREDYCDRIDCLDDPGVYPQGQLAYWAGAHFIEYLEQKREGSVRCLVEINSSAIPFFLNNAFIDCTGENAQSQFEKFREKIIHEAAPKNQSETWGDKINNAHGSDDFQKGIVLDGDVLYKVERDRYTEALMSYDLSEAGGLSLVKQKYSSQLSDLSGIVTLPNAENEPTKYLVTAFIEDPRYRKESKKWKLVNAETLLIERSLALKNDPSYVIALGNNRYITASYLDNHWTIEKQKLNEKDILIESEKLHELSSDFNIVSLQKAGEKIFMKINDGDASTLAYSDLTLEKFFTIYRNVAFFDVSILEEDFVVIDQDGVHTLIELDKSTAKASLSTLSKEALKNVSKALINESRVVFLENRLKTKGMTREEGLNFLKTNRSSVAAENLSTLEFKPKEKSADLPTENYPQLYHLSPNYWFLATGNGENISSIGAMTTFNDPMDIHVLNATALIYPSISELGGSLDYVHKLSQIDDLWSVNAGFNQEFSRTEINDSLKESREFSVGTGYSFLMKKWTDMPGIFFSSSYDKDFISDRTTNSFGVRNFLIYEALSFDDFFQDLFSQVKMQVDSPERGDTFFNFQTRLLTEFRFSDTITGQVNTAYGKLFKKDFSRGVLYGGGTNSLSSQRYFEFYGIPYSNAFGNEIFTLRLAGDYNFWNIYRGYQFFPLFIKEAHLLLGRETMYADRIFLDRSLIREKAVNSFFAGIRLESNLFYYVPTNIDLIYSTTAHPNGNEVTQWTFLINAELF